MLCTDWMTLGDEISEGFGGETWRKETTWQTGAKIWG